MKRSGHGLIEDIVLAFALRHWRNHTKNVKVGPYEFGAEVQYSVPSHFGIMYFV
jgi:hypothetical protein